jgi:hypothetical protein
MIGHGDLLTESLATVRAETCRPRLPRRVRCGLEQDATDRLDFRRREWSPAIEASGIATPARIYDLRSTFASNALAAGVTVFELARIMGTSVRMIEKHYGTLLEGAHAGLVARLDALEVELARAAGTAEV